MRGPISTNDLLECIVQNRAQALDAAALADLFSQMVWIFDDNGEQLLDTLQRWLDGDDYYRAEIALGIKGIFLFRSRREMASKFEEVSRKWPGLEIRCQNVLRRWDETVGNRLP